MPRNFSWPILLSDFTWSIQNNTLGWFGMEGTLRLWYSLLRGKPGEFIDSTPIYSDRVGTWGLARHRGLFLLEDDRAWTYQHLVYAFNRLTSAPCFALRRTRKRQSSFEAIAARP